MMKKIKKILPYWLSSLLLACLSLAITAGSGENLPKTAYQAAEPYVLGASTRVRGQEPETTAAPVKISEPDLSGISAKAFLVYDEASGRTILEKNPEDALSIASLTKLLTALVVYKQTDLNEAITVTGKPLVKTSPVLRLAAGDKVKIQDLFNAMLIGSANDAAEVLAQAVEEKTQKKFSGLMNEQARDLGMSASSFSNPLGFESRYNYSTAADLKKLVVATQRLAAFSNLGKSASYEFSGESGRRYQIKATNKLILSHTDFEAVKTGYTDASKGSMAVKAARSGHKIVIIVLNSLNREQDSISLADRVFESFAWK